MPKEVDGWDAETVRALRERLGISQRELADELGVRQQTVSEWETGMYRPRGASARMLRVVAERAARYESGTSTASQTTPDAPADEPPAASTPKAARRARRRYHA